MMSGKTTLLHVSDVHFGAQDDHAVETVREAAEDMKADALVISGDLTQRGAHSEFDEAARWLDRFSMPVIVVPGNHDTPLLNMTARLTSPFRRFRSYTNDYPNAQQVGDAYLRGINTARGWQARRNWAEGVVDLEDLEKACQDSRAADGPVRILVCHHPLRPPETAPISVSTIRGSRALRRLAESAFDLLLCGHVHVPFSSVYEEEGKRLVLVGAGTLSSRLRDHPPSFNRIDITPENVTVERHDILANGTVNEPLATWKLAPSTA